MVPVNKSVGWVARRSMDTDRTASYLSTWTYPSPQLIRYAPHFPVSSSQHFKLLYILRD